MKKVYVIGMVGGGYVASLRADIRGVYTSRDDAISYLKSEGIRPRGDKTWDSFIHERVVDPSSKSSYKFKCTLFIHSVNREGFCVTNGYESIIKKSIDSAVKVDEVNYRGDLMSSEIVNFGVEESFGDYGEGEDGQVEFGNIDIEFSFDEKPSVDKIIEFAKSELVAYNKIKGLIR